MGLFKRQQQPLPPSLPLIVLSFRSQVRRSSPQPLSNQFLQRLTEPKYTSSQPAENGFLSRSPFFFHLHHHLYISTQRSFLPALTLFFAIRSVPASAAIRCSDSFSYLFSVDPSGIPLSFFLDSRHSSCWSAAAATVTFTSGHHLESLQTATARHGRPSLGRGI